MKDIKARIEKLLTDADECELIGRLAANPEKRAAFQKLAGEYRKMGRELETIVVNEAIPDHPRGK